MSNFLGNPSILKGALHLPFGSFSLVALLALVGKKQPFLRITLMMWMGKLETNIQVETGHWKATGGSVSHLTTLAKRFFTSNCLFSFQREHPAGKNSPISMLAGELLQA